MPLAHGSKPGLYEVVAPFGVGGMGKVYRARAPRLGEHDPMVHWRRLPHCDEVWR